MHEERHQLQGEDDREKTRRVDLLARFHRQPISRGLSYVFLDRLPCEAEMPQRPVWLQQAAVYESIDRFSRDLKAISRLLRRVTKRVARQFLLFRLHAPLTVGESFS